MSCQSCGNEASGLLCGWCSLNYRDTAAELARMRRRDIPTVNVAVENDDDWRSHVLASSRLPKFVQINPEGKSAAKYLRDGRRASNPDLRGLETVDPFEDCGGDDMWRAMTLSEIADELECSVERIRQIEAQAMRKIRSRAKFLRSFVQP